MSSPTDVAWEIITWTCVEVDVGLICTSAPGIKPLVHSILPNLFSSNTGSKPASSTWPSRTARSHSRHPEATFELNSKEDLQQTDGGITNTFWVGNDGEANGPGSPTEGSPGIIKTVSMMVTTDPRDPSVRSMDDSVERFEHV